MWPTGRVAGALDMPPVLDFRNVSPAGALRGDYEEQGYAIARGLVPAPLVERILGFYRRDIVTARARFFRQNTNRYEHNRITVHGHVAQSFLDIHAYRSFAGFRDAALEIFFDDALMAALGGLTGAGSHRLVQSMLFDLNTATPPHQDWWYVDSIPNGHLAAAWIALEDIHEKAGRFFVMAGSHRLVFHEPGLSHSEWLERMRRYVAEHPSELRAPALRKGDVLFWNSRTVHGSLPTADDRHSRKSLTCHFVPDSMAFGNLFTRKDWARYRRFRGHRYWANQPEYSLKHMVISKLKAALYDHPVLVSVMRRWQRRGIGDY